MRNTIEYVLTIKEPRQDAAGFAKRGLATLRLDLVGLSGSYCTATQLGERMLDDAKVRKSVPSDCRRALVALGQVSIPAFGMLWPVFPDGLEAGALHALVRRVRQAPVQDFCATAFSVQASWRSVRDGYVFGSSGLKPTTEVYGDCERSSRSQYAAEAYTSRLGRAHESWISKPRLVLYDDILGTHGPAVAGLACVLAQSKPSTDSFSTYLVIARLQLAAKMSAATDGRFTAGGVA